MNNFLINLISMGLAIVVVGGVIGAIWLLDTYYTRKDIKEWQQKVREQEKEK